jgi:hypothetical protein
MKPHPRLLPHCAFFDLAHVPNSRRTPAPKRQNKPTSSDKAWSIGGAGWLIDGEKMAMRQRKSGSKSRRGIAALPRPTQRRVCA